jgi:hypothetical protein
LCGSNSQVPANNADYYALNLCCRRRQQASDFENVHSFIIAAEMEAQIRHSTIQFYLAMTVTADAMLAFERSRTTDL